MLGIYVLKDKLAYANGGERSIIESAVVCAENEMDARLIVKENADESHLFVNGKAFIDPRLSTCELVGYSIFEDAGIVVRNEFVGWRDR